MLKDSQQPEITEITKSFKQNQKRLAGIAYNILSARGIEPKKEEIEDVISETYLTAVDKLNNYRGIPIKHVLAWIRRILFFTCLNYLKTRSRFKKFQREIDHIIDDAELFELLASSRDDLEVSVFIKQILASLSKDDRRIIDLSISGYTSEEIGKRVRSNPDAVRKQKSRIIKKLKKKIG